MIKTGRDTASMPSEFKRRLTAEVLRGALTLLGVKVRDHIVVGAKDVKSLAELGKI